MYKKMGIVEILKQFEEKGEILYFIGHYDSLFILVKHQNDESFRSYHIRNGHINEMNPFEKAMSFGDFYQYIQSQITIFQD